MMRLNRGHLYPTPHNQFGSSVYITTQLMKILRESKLAFKKGTSDKVYNITLYRTDDGQYSVITEYGRRSATDLKVVIKYQGPNQYEAGREYDDVLYSKRAKGYKEV